jgi:type IV secretion system protein VirD4
MYGAPKSLEASKAISEMLGEESIEVQRESRSGKRFGALLDHKQEQLDLMARPVLTPFEVREIPQDHMVAFVNGLSLYLRKFFYYQQPELDQRSTLPVSTSSAKLLAQIPFHASVRAAIGFDNFDIIQQGAKELAAKRWRKPVPAIPPKSQTTTPKTVVISTP